MKKLAPAVVLGTILLLGSAAPSFATDDVCHVETTVTVVIDTPYAPAVYETVPAVYKTELEFVFKKDHPNSPRWELEGWNSDTNPASEGWTATGNTREVLVSEETTVLVTPEVAEVSHEETVETEVCEPPVVVDPPVVEEPPVVEAPPVVAEQPPVVVPPAAVVAPAAAAPVVEVKPVPVAAKAELAQTGANDSLGLVGMLALFVGLVGAALVFFKKRLVK